VDPRQQVVLATLLSFTVFVSAGPRALNRVQGKVSGTSDKSDSGWTAKNAFGFAVLFTFLIIGADVPATADLSIAFAWLILLSVLMLFGPVAFKNLSGIFGGTA
jgi:hypothetical protein